jgi:hypothetical protein
MHEPILQMNRFGIMNFQKKRYCLNFGALFLSKVELKNGSRRFDLL